MPLWLRYNDKSMILPSGQLFVGRSAECHVVVSDPLASRRHAMITMSQMGAFVTDLGSKAGVMVNGLLISGARRLQTGDTIQIAGSRLVVENVELPEEEEPTDPRMRSTISPPAYPIPGSGRLAPTPPLGIPRVQPPMRLSPPEDTLDEEEDSDVFARTMEAPRVTIPDTAQRAPAPDSGPRTQRAPRTDDADSSRTAKPAGAPAPAFPRPENLRSLAIAAEKALVMGRAEDAERIMQRSLLDTRDASDHGEVDGETAEMAATFASRLSGALGAGRWFDYAVSLYAARGELMPATVVDQLLAAVRKAKPIDKAAFRRYLAEARELAGDSPARRFVIQRLEGVQRLLDLK